MKQKLPDISVFKKQLLYHFRTEKLNANKTLSINKFDKLWSPLSPLIQVLEDSNPIF